MHLCQPNEFSDSPRAGSKLGFVQQADKNYNANVAYSKCQPKAMFLYQQKNSHIDLTQSLPSDFDNFVSLTQAL